MLKKDRWGNDRPADSHGRYVKYIFGEPYNDNMARIKSYDKRQRISAEEKQALKDISIKNRLEKQDYYLIKELTNTIRNVNRYAYVSINKPIVNDKGLQVTEIDIETKRYVIEVKSGKCKHCMNQFLTQKKYSKTFNKQYIVYAPKISKGVEKECKRNELTIIKDIDTFKKYIGGK